MPLTLYVDGDRWRAHLQRGPRRAPRDRAGAQGQRLRLRPRAARRAGPTWLGVDTVAVGTYDEVPEVAAALRRRSVHGAHARGARSRPARRLRRRTCVPHRRPARGPGRRCSRAASPAAAGRARAADLDAAARLLRPRPARGGRAPRAAVAVEGVAMHLPISPGLAPDRGQPADDRRGRAPGCPTDRVYVSPPHRHRAGALRQSLPRLRVPPPDRHRAVARRPRTRCGSRATVLDVHPVERGDVFGYRSRTAPRGRHDPGGSGGTAHGIGLEAPTGGATLKDRAARIAKGGLDAAGLRPLAVHRRRQAAAVRRAAAHAGLDAVPARRRAGARRSATRSTCGCGSPRPRSTRPSSTDPGLVIGSGGDRNCTRRPRVATASGRVRGRSRPRPDPRGWPPHPDQQCQRGTASATGLLGPGQDISRRTSDAARSTILPGDQLVGGAPTSNRAPQHVAR